MSAPYWPGRFSRPRLIGSKLTMNSAPCAWAARGERLDLFQAAEEIRVLHDDAGGLVVDGLLAGRRDRGSRRGVGSVSTCASRLAR